MEITRKEKIIIELNTHEEIFTFISVLDKIITKEKKIGFNKKMLSQEEFEIVKGVNNMMKDIVVIQGESSFYKG